MDEPSEPAAQPRPLRAHLLAGAALLAGWIPWVGLALAIAATALALRERRRAVLLPCALAMLLGIAGTAAFHLLPRGSLEGETGGLDLFEVGLQPAGNLEENLAAT